MIRGLPRKVSRIALAGLLVLPASSFARDKGDAPPCYGEENFATQTALVQMVNSGLIKNFASIYRDDHVPYHLKTRLLDSRAIGKYSAKDFPSSVVYREIQKTEVATKEGHSFEILTISEATSVECSMSGPTIILIAPEFKVLGVGTSVLSTMPDAVPNSALMHP